MSKQKVIKKLTHQSNL